MGALQTAGWALSEYEGNTMPYTPEAKYALTESLHIYDSGNGTKAQYQLATAGIIDAMIVSPDGKTAVTFDRTARLSVWDIASGNLIDVISDLDALFSDRYMVFVDDDRFAYWSNDGSVHIYRISEKKVSDTIAVESVPVLTSDSKGKYLAVSGWHELKIYDMSTLQLLYTFDVENGQSSMDCYFSDADIAVYAESTGSDETAEDASDNGRTTLHFVNLTDGTVYATQTIAYNNVKEIDFKGQQVYVSANYLFRDFQDIKSGVIACNVTDGTVLWEYAINGKVINDMVLPYVEDAANIMIYTASDILLLDRATGEEVRTFSVGSEIAGSGVFMDAERFLVFSRDGEFGILYPEEQEIYSIEGMFDCKSQNVKTFKVADGCFLVLPYNDNRVTIYATSQNPDMTPYEGEFVKEDIAADDADYVAEAEKLGLGKSALVTYIMYSPDESVIFVSYSDATLEIYHTADMTLLETINDLGSGGYISQYLGTDQEGNIYIAGTRYGYCLDSNYRLIAKIEKLLMVDGENNQLIVGSEDNMYALPIYTTEALLDMIPTDSNVTE